ncbi:hypothetical protein ABIC03_007752 [Bradyrhizobium sp. RT6a]|jgi:hypothetical protein
MRPLRHAPIDSMSISGLILSRHCSVIGTTERSAGRSRAWSRAACRSPLRFRHGLPTTPRSTGARCRVLFPLLIRITRRGSLGRHTTLHDRGTVRILTEAVPCDRTAFLRRRDRASHECCAKSEQDKAVSHHAGPLGVVCDAPTPLAEACVAPLKWNLRETRGRHGRIWILLSHHIARAVRPLREMMRTASHNNWRNIRL